jgi:hypothetical protein
MAVSMAARNCREEPPNKGVASSAIEASYPNGHEPKTKNRRVGYG